MTQTSKYPCFLLLLTAIFLSFFTPGTVSAATISGTVYQSDGSTPVTGAGYVAAYSGDPCGGYGMVGSGTIDSTYGTYTINGLPSGTYFLRAFPNENLIHEWWAGPNSVIDCSGAQFITVTAETTIEGKDFQLDAGAAFSGTVYQSDGSTFVIGGGRVYAYTGDPCGSYSWAGSGAMDFTDGTYTINGLPSGTYFLRAFPSENFIHEWWADPNSVIDCSGAQSTTVIAGNTVTGKNFQLDLGAAITGTAYESNGSTPITGGGWVGAYTGDPCGPYTQVSDGYINSTDGTYTINGLPSGTYFLRTEPYGNFINEWWASPSSVIDCSGAQSTTVIAGNTVTGKNFQLDPGATISGTVFENDGSTPVTGGGLVYAFTGDPCGPYSWAGSGSINTIDGTYTINGLPSGTYFLRTEPYGNFINEWWASPSSVIDCSSAQSTTVIAGNTVTGKNFQLDPGATISGTVFENDGSTPVTGGGWIGAFTGNPCGSHSWVADAYINPSNGTYTINGLPSGDYFLLAQPDGNYRNEWWASPSSVIDCNGAQFTTAIAGNTISGKNFQLDPAATISGTIFESDGSTPVTGGGLVYAFTGDPCGAYSWVEDAYINSYNGTYTITGLPSGSYFLQAHAYGNFISEWWASPTSVTDCNGAQSTTVIAGNTVSGKNFQLDPAATISGTVFENDGSTPVTGGGYVQAYTGDPCGAYYSAGSASINSADGTYTINWLTTGSYFLKAYPSGNYLDEWWASPDSVLDCNSAQSVSATEGTTVSGKNFQLNPGAAISGTVFQHDGSTPVTGGGSVQAYIGDPCGSHSWAGSASINSTDGTYTINQLPTGSYFLEAYPYGNYFDEWWASPVSVLDCNGAQSVSATEGTTVSGKDFQLNSAAAISGTVFQHDGSTPISGGGDVYAYTGDPCGTYSWAGYASINSTDGTYTINRLTTGSYFLKAYPSGNYLDEWWASPDSVLDCNSAQSVSATEGTTVSGKNFQLNPAAAISGNVFQADGSTPVTGGGSVYAYTGDPCGEYSSAGSGYIDSQNGTYTINGLTTGSYFLKTWVYSGYTNEWWASPLSVIDCGGAESVSAVEGSIATGKNFQLSGDAAITGTVTSDTDGQPVPGVQVCTQPFTGGESRCTTTMSDGTYTLSDLEPGYTRVEASGAGYLTEYYQNSYDPNWATALWTSGGQTTYNINFSMGHYGSISGTIYQSNGTTPLANACVGAYMHACGSSPYARAQTDSGGNFSISDLPPGSYLIHTRAACTDPLHYVDQWWTESGGTAFCDQAGPVTVISDQNTPGINFSLLPSPAAYPGPTYNWATVFSAHHADGTTGTELVASVSGPGPKDVASITASGPSGTFTLTLAQAPFRQMGNFYLASSHSVINDGTYTFVVTDSLGRTATTARSFTYDSAIPQVDSATMKVEGKDNNAYIGTTTPTLTWGAVNRSGTTHYYQVFIWDYDGRAIWYHETTQSTSITVPDGYLLPDTPYRWWVRVQDESGQNRHYSDTLYFYTGQEGLTPDVSQNLPYAYTGPDTPGATWFGVHNVNLAPWDIDNLRVTGPNGTLYPYNGRSWFGYTSMWYNCWSSGPFPLPDGTYTYSVTDNASNTYTATTNHTYAHVMTISEASRIPAENAYLYTKSPTFSWNPPTGTGSFYYSLRIYDYNSRVGWYSSPPTTETSFTLPEEVIMNLPLANYKWQVRVYNGPVYDGTNAALSPMYTFTIPPLFTRNYTLPKGTGVVTSYRLFTVPYYMGSGTNLLKAMEKVLGSYDPTHWRVFAVLNGINVEITANDFTSLTIVPGMAFWIITLCDNTVIFEGALCPQDTRYTRTLPAGWQTISLPWAEGGVNLGDIMVSDGTHTYHLTDSGNTLTQTCLWDYTGTGPEPYAYYEKRSDPDYPLVNGTGYLLQVLAPNVTVTIPPPAATAESGIFVKANAEQKAGGLVNEPPPLFFCKVGQNTRSPSGDVLLPLPPGGRIARSECSECSGNEKNLRLDNVTFDSATPCRCSASESITIGENVKIKSSADVTFAAPRVNLKSGVQAEEGAAVVINQE